MSRCHFGEQCISSDRITCGRSTRAADELAAAVVPLVHTNRVSRHHELLLFESGCAVTGKFEVTNAHSAIARATRWKASTVTNVIPCVTMGRDDPSLRDRTTPFNGVLSDCFIGSGR